MSKRFLRCCSPTQRGATLIEAAIGVAIFFTCLFAVIQFAFLVFAYLDSRNAASLGSRRGEIVANEGGADGKILETIRRETYLVNDAQIERVVVFWASDENSAVPPACLTANNQGLGQGVKGSACNIYTNDEVRTLTAETVSKNNRDKAWPAPERNVSRNGPPDYLGVTVVIRSGSFGIIKINRTFTSTSINRLQARTA